MNTEIITEATETKMQFILDENKVLQEISKDKCKSVEYPIKYKLKNAFEIFVHVRDAENYWISNYGRCVNNHRTPDDFTNMNKASAIIRSIMLKELKEHLGGLLQ